jgi:hypothetical protein
MECATQKVYRQALGRHERVARVQRPAGTNWMGYPSEDKPFSPILAKRTGWVNPLILKVLILKILRTFIRWRRAAISDRNTSDNIANSKTNWMGYLADYRYVDLILVKRTGWPKPVSALEMILKILRPFIRFEKLSAISGQPSTEVRIATGFLEEINRKSPIGNYYTEVTVNPLSVQASGVVVYFSTQTPSWLSRFLAWTGSPRRSGEVVSEARSGCKTVLV